METREVSSSLPAPPESPKSFRTAKTISSSLTQPNTSAPELVYRQVNKLPYELREVCRIYFEEGLCMSPETSARVALTDQMIKIPKL